MLIARKSKSNLGYLAFYYVQMLVICKMRLSLETYNNSRPGRRRVVKKLKHFPRHKIGRFSMRPVSDAVE